MFKTARFVFGTASAMILFAGMAFAQQDPGIQTASRGTGASIIPTSDTTGFLTFFNDGLSRFQEVETVSAGANVGLGPRFNSNSCVSCHAQPTIGGSGAAAGSPQFTFTTKSDGIVSGAIAAGNTMPSFITSTGPTREARFPFMMNANGTVDTSVPSGNVEDIFTVAGRSDRGTCTSLAQPNFAAAEAAGNVIFRIPTPVFGLGLVENLDDSTLLANQTKNLANSFGIGGTFNRSGNDNTITKFGWKAQNKSLHIFAGEAYNVEMGITNLLFTNEKPLFEEEMAGTGLPETCLNLTGTGYPEDASNPLETTNAAVLDDVSAFANFMRFLAPPPPGGVILNGTAVPAATIAAGKTLFTSIGCATCHNPSPGNTQVSNLVPALSNKPVPAYSDFEIHHMGTGFADNVAQGNAGGDEFRTAPLWGLGQRAFFDPDGRDPNLNAAVQNHASSGSEATTVITNYNNLSATSKQEVLDFLRSL